VSDRGERGSAIVEFHLLGLVLLVPLIYVLLAALDVQRTSYAVTQAAREAGRLFVASGEESAARQAAAVALGDHGVEVDAAQISFACSVTPCYQPGAQVRVVVDAVVALPFLPDVLAGAVHAQVPVSATHVSVVDRFRELP
jgi:Flp pilus assembly protein TadG